MNKCFAIMVPMLAAALAAQFAMAPTAHAASPVKPRSANLMPECPAGEDCGGGGGDPGGGGGGGTQPTYVLQGVIQNEGYETNAQGGKRLKIRAYSRFANANNDRVDASYINVRCNAYDNNAPGSGTTDYDSENNGALVDVHFNSNFVYGVYRTITVICLHHATYGVNVYDATSTAEIAIPY